MGKTHEELFQVGTVTGTHGLRGDIKVRPLTPGSTSILAAQTLWLRRETEGDFLTYKLRKASVHKASLLVRLEGVESIDAAAPLKGALVFMSREELPDLEEGQSYWYELQGAEVIDRRLGSIGTLEDVFETAAHDVYVVQGRFGEVLIPAVDEFILEFDEENACLHVDLPLGLVDEAKAEQVP
ncbi:ribosome maturation factor RimM [Geoalkalibacter halelectricus]|uniref:Ribosome maturation factor RimM n=1 Tax=Geoalkalibacter halelectricus TaxID=2847045 RepID=A0ABY5ZM02_9BACT|nr:ribosome maturation factor RimM [Geoalkalibacter halelectricus]MDO3378810.1 ribosome maturation factor RimM [Geoalkalibacter halelectricus]UWZ79884.1 ribosome maturation factor RimM [Geoalkalibacter halelectricus]